MGAARHGGEFAALELGLGAVEPALRAGRESDNASLQGIADAVNTGIVRRLRIPHPAPLFDASWSPDGSRFAVAGGNSRVYVRNARTGRLLQTLVLPAGPGGRDQRTESVAFSPDGARLVTATKEDAKVRVWNLPKGGTILREPERTLSVSGAASFAAAFFPDGKRILTTAGNNTARIWNLADGTYRELKGRHENYVWSVAVSRDGKWAATAGEDGMVKVWNAATGALVAETSIFLQQAGAMHFDPNNWRGATGIRFGVDTLLCVGKGTTAFTWAWWRGNDHIHRIYPHPQGRLWSGDISHDDTMVATAGEFRKVTLWNRGRGEWSLFTLDTHTDDVYAARFAPNRYEFVTASKDRTAEVWKITQPIYFNTGAIMFHAEFSRDGKRFLAAGEDGIVQVVPTGQSSGWAILNRGGKENRLVPVWHTTFAPDGRHMVTADQEGQVRLWKTGGAKGRLEEPLREFAGHTGTVNAAAFAPGGRRLATAGNDGTVRLWDVATGKEAVPRFHWGGTRFRSVRYSPDGMLLAAAASDGAVYVLDTKTMRPFRQGKAIDGRLFAPGHRYIHGTAVAPYDAVFSPDGRYIAAASSDGSVYLWATQTWALAATLAEASGEVYSVDFSPDGRRLVSAHADGVARLWRLSDGLAAAKAKRDGAPYLTLRGHVDKLLTVRFSPDGEQIITASRDGTTRLFPATTRAYVKKAREILREAAPTPVRTPVERKPRVGEGSRFQRAMEACYRRNGGADILGEPLGPVFRRDDIDHQVFHGLTTGKGEIIAWRDASGVRAYFVHGAIWAHYNASDGVRSPLGPPLSDEEAFPLPSRQTGHRSRFERGDIYHQPELGSWAIMGKMRDEFRRRGGLATLGFPVKDAEANGTRQEFERGVVELP